MSEILDYYDSYDERNRVLERHRLELLRSQEIIARYLPGHPIRIIDIGGAAGAYSFWLAGLGHHGCRHSRARNKLPLALRQMR